MCPLCEEPLCYLQRATAGGLEATSWCEKVEGTRFELLERQARDICRENMRAAWIASHLSKTTMSQCVLARVTQQQIYPGCAPTVARLPSSSTCLGPATPVTPWLWCFWNILPVLKFGNTFRNTKQASHWQQEWKSNLEIAIALCVWLVFPAWKAGKIILDSQGSN